MITALHFKCPSCGGPLAKVEGLLHATVIARRTCPRTYCRETWQLKIECIKNDPTFIQMHKAEFTFIGRLGKPLKRGKR